MFKLKKYRVIALLTLIVFLASSIVPPQAHAWHLSAWHVWGKWVNGGSVPDSNRRHSKPSGGTQNQGSGGDPVYLKSGEFYYYSKDLTIPGRGMDVEIFHLYQSGMRMNSFYGFNWIMNYHMRLQVQDNGNARILRGDMGRSDIYQYSAGNYVSPDGQFNTLVQNGDGTWDLTERDGKVLKFSIEGLLDSITDRNGNQITFTYSASKVSVSSPINDSAYHSGRASLTMPAIPSPTTYIPIVLDYRLEKITDTLGRDIDFNYDATNHLQSIVDFNGRTVSFTYDSDANISTITSPTTSEYPAGLTKTFTYNSEHLMETLEDQRSNVYLTNVYDSEGRVEEQTHGYGTYYFSYGANSTTLTDRLGNVTTYVLNDKGNVTSKEQFTRGIRSTDPASFLTTNTYNDDGSYLTTTYPNGNGVKYVYDTGNADARAHGNVTQVRFKEDMAVADNDTNDIVYNLTYESQFNRAKTYTDPLGNVTTYHFDYELPITDSKYGTVGNVVKITRPTVGTQTPEIELTYNAFGQVTQVVDANGNITDYEYDTSGTTPTYYLTKIIQDPSGINAQTELTYDVYGGVDTVKDANNHTTDYDINAVGWLTKETNPLGYETKYTYDENGNVTTIERQADASATTWQTTNLTYDINDNLKTMTDPLSRVTTYNYDVNENIISIVDANTKTTSYSYDERDLLYQVTDANTPTAGVTQYDYSLNAQLAKITDANSNATDYAYDGFERLITKNYDDASSEAYQYDKNRNLTKVTRPDTAVIDFVYDDLNRLTNKNFPASTTLDVTYTYDVGSRLISANTTAANNAFTYDALNRVLSNTQTVNSNSYTVSYQYDAAGNRTKLTYPTTKVVDYVYDNNDRMTQIDVNTTQLASFVYDTLDRRTERAYNTSPNNQRASYAYDIANQLFSITNTLLPSTNISTYAYPTYDNVGNRTRMDRTFGTNPLQATNYTYNDIYELTGVSGAQTNSYAYDLVRNRTTVDSVAYTLASNGLNQYNQVGTTSITYSSNGNLTDDGTNIYTYDEQNRLATVNDGSTTSSYAYDAFNRRVSKTVGSTSTYFIYNFDEVIGEYNSSNVLQSEYVYGAGVDQILTMERSSNTYYYHQDGLGSVTEVTNASGGVQEYYAYDSYGQVTIYDSSNTVITSSAIDNPYMYTGRRLDSESSMYHYRNRMYNPSMGLFLQRDPLGYIDSFNLYSYVSNNPINYIDPYGLVTFQIGGFTSGGIGAGGSQSAGFIFSWHPGDGFRIGRYHTAHGGMYVGQSISGGVELGFSWNRRISNAAGYSIKIGGSGGVGVSAGIDAEISLEGSKPTTTVSFGGGVGASPSEVHIMAGHTWVEEIFGPDKGKISGDPEKFKK